jgi:O-antigen/teichoic acid export membrane protein
MAVYIRSDVFLIERLLPEGKEAGVYAAAYRFLDVSNNVTGVLFAGILLPLFGRMLAQKESVQPLVRLSVNLLLPVAITAMIIAFFFGEQIMHMQLKGMASEYDSKIFAYDGKVFTLLMAAFPGYCIGYVYATLLTANGNIKSLIGVSIIAVILNLVLNFILVPLYGAWGGALTCCITQCFLSVANILLAKKILRLKADWNWVLRYPVFMLIIFGCCYLMSKSDLGFWMQLFIIAGVAGVSMFICGFLPFRKIKELLLNK